MENRNIGHEDRNESALQPAAATRLHEFRDASLSGDELHLLIEFFRLLDRWERQEVVQ